MKRPALFLLIVLLLFSTVACNGLFPQTREETPTAEIPEEVLLPPDTEQPVATEAAPVDEPPAEEPTKVPEQPATSLVDTTWEWVTVIDPMGQTIVTDPSRYTVRFADDGSAAVQADCNAVSASYFLDGSSLSIELGATTLVACPPDSQDTMFLNTLSRAAAYTVEDGELFIEMVADSGTMVFRSAGSGPAVDVPAEAEQPFVLTGQTWQWVSTTTPAEVITAADPTRYTIVFNEDGSAGIVADCNRVGASYTVQDSSLSITLGPSTLVGCPPDSQATPFLAGLASAAIYFIEDDMLYIDLVADSGTMQFSPQTGDTGEVEMSGDADLIATTWAWASVTSPEISTSVADPSRYNVTFNEDNSLMIKADCNTVLGTYMAGEDGSLNILLGPSTLVACPPDSQDVEFLGYLANARFYFIETGVLSIEVSEDGTTMQFNMAEAGEPSVEIEPPPAEGGAGAIAPPGGVVATGLVGPLWQWTDIVQSSSAVAVPNPANFTVRFNPDGTANIQADCNVGVATYIAGADGSLTITPGPFTLAFCGQGSPDQVFIGGLTNAKSYTLADNRLSIEMLYESGSLVFAPGQ